MRKFYGLKRLTLVLAILAATLNVTAQNQPPTIDVQGSAEVKVVPDEVFILFGVEISSVSNHGSTTWETKGYGLNTGLGRI